MTAIPLKHFRDPGIRAGCTARTLTLFIISLFSFKALLNYENNTAILLFRIFDMPLQTVRSCAQIMFAFACIFRITKCKKQCDVSMKKRIVNT